MSEEKDFNELVEDIFLSEQREQKTHYDRGFKAGIEAGNLEGYHLGYHRGAELGRELGYYLGIVSHHINLNEELDIKYSSKVVTQLMRVKELIDTFPRNNSEEHDILGMAETIRAQFKKACALLKIPSSNPYDAESPMQSTIRKVCLQIESITKYLTPILPIANCHMVEFITQNHWETLVPANLRDTLDGMELNDAVDQFWGVAEQVYKDNSPLYEWINTASSHCLSVNNEYCLSNVQLQQRIKSRGADIRPEIRIKEFMTSKKSYEVQTMSRLVASLHTALDTTCCVEAGGGRGHLPVALCLAYSVPSLTVDCDAAAVENAPHRVKIIQKQWHAIAKRINDGIEENITKCINNNLHRFARAFITKDTDLSAVVKEKFPEYTNSDVKLLLTGLHTCGNLGPDSLRIFTKQPSIRAVFNVPCCYHLLTESVDWSMFDVFQRDYRNEEDSTRGFPMSECLRGYNLGRNARMLASQSIDRVVSKRQLPSKSLLYRAMLQAIIQDYLPNRSISEGKLKKITVKCNCFETYFKMADEILNLELFDSLPASFYKDLRKTMDCQWKKLVLFYLIRLCLAQVVESLILLDRLMFMFENGFDHVYLVKLFDPVLSPRCHSIVAVR